jgi:hypothetical protein
MRVLLAFALLGLVAGECPITKWLEEHGKDVLETVMECKDMPAAIQKVRDSDCRASPSPKDKVAMAVWYAVTAMEHLNGTLPDLVKHSKVAEKLKDVATMQIIASAHKSVVHSCSQPKCMDDAKAFGGVAGRCYSSLMCNFMTKWVPFKSCQVAFDKYFENSMASQLDSSCMSDHPLARMNKTVYCSELKAALMLKDFDCFIEYKSSGAKGCTERCVSLWKKGNERFPTCAKAFGDETTSVFKNLRTMMIEMAKDSTDPGFKKAAENFPASMPTYEDKCLTKPIMFENMMV